MKKFRLLFSFFLLFGIGSKSSAFISVVFNEVGDDVVATYSGSADLTDLSYVSAGFISAALDSDSYLHVVGGSVEFYNGMTGPSSLGFDVGSRTLATSTSGSPFGMQFILGQLRVPDGYVSGTEITGSATWENEDFSSLGLREGSYTWTWGTGASADSLVINVANPPIAGEFIFESALAIENLWSVTVSGFDGDVYTLRRSGGIGMLGRLAPDGLSNQSVPRYLDRPSGVFVDPDDGDIFVTEDFGGVVRRISSDYTANQTWVSVFSSGDDDTAGGVVVPDYYSGSVVNVGDGLVVDRGFSGIEGVYRFSPDTAGGEETLLTFSGADALYGIVATDTQIIAIESDRGLLELTTDGTTFSLQQIVTTPAIPTVKAGVWDRHRKLLYLALTDVAANESSVVAYDPATGSMQTVITGLAQLRWNSLAVSADGSKLYLAEYGTGWATSQLLTYQITAHCNSNLPLLRPDTATAKSEFTTSFDGSAINTINGSGMPLGFNATDNHQIYKSGNHWVTDSAFPEGNTITWGFNQPQTLTSIVLWNHQSSEAFPGSDGYDVTGFDLMLLDENGNEIEEITDVELYPNTASGQILGFAREIKNVSTVRLTIVAVEDSLQYAALAEVAFNAPLPFERSTFENAVYAWSGNTGWVNFAPCPEVGVRVMDTYLSGFAYNANTGWLRVGGVAPDNGRFFSNTGDDHGVNMDANGNLSGYAWSANTGWVNFNVGTSNDPNAPRVDLMTGEFSGYAWNANTGWLNLGTGLLTTELIRAPDYDGDNIGDSWEYENFGSLDVAGINTDFDQDGASDSAEYVSNTDPTNASSFLRIVSTEYHAGYTEATIEFTSSPYRLYRIEYSNDLGLNDPWDNGGLADLLGDPSGISLATFTYPSNNKKFFRISAINPLSE
jgi:hypothetical protein